MAAPWPSVDCGRLRTVCGVHVVGATGQYGIRNESPFAPSG